MVDTETLNGTLAIMQYATEHLDSNCFWFDEPFTENDEQYPAHVFDEVEDLYDSSGFSGMVGQTRQISCLLVDKISKYQSRKAARDHIDTLYRELRDALNPVEYNNALYTFAPARMQGPVIWQVGTHEQVGIRIVWETEDIF